MGKVNFKDYSDFADRGWMLSEIGDWVEARKYFRKAIDCLDEEFTLTPPDAESLNYSLRGNLKYELDDFRGALDDLNEAIKICPKNALYYRSRADAKYELEDYEGAIKDFTQVIGTYAEDPELYYLIGASKLNLENYKGCSDINKAIELGKADGYDWEWLDSVEANFCSN